MIWRGERMSRFRSTWTRADWIGAVTLAIGVLIVGGAYLSARSPMWYLTTTFFQDRMIDYGLWAAGALTIGLGLVPLIAGLASLVRPKGEAPQPGVEALTTVTVAAIIYFGLYTAIKAAYLSTVYGTPTLERNLIYLVPLLFAGSALFFQRRRARRRAVVAAGCFALYLVHTTPYSLTQYPNYEAHGLAIIALANRIFRWPADTIEHALIGMTLVVTAILALLSQLRGRRVAMLLTAIVAAATLAWTGAAEVYAARGEQLFSEQLYSTLAKPPNWLDRQTQGQSVVFLGQSIKDANPINLLEFWNRSLTKIWAIDGTAPGPGATATPDIETPDGRLTDPHTDYALDDTGRRSCRATGNNRRGQHSRQAQRDRVAAPHRPDGHLPGRLDGQRCELLALRCCSGTARAPSGRVVTGGVVRQGRSRRDPGQGAAQSRSSPCIRSSRASPTRPRA